jgi:hypothetical protein
VAKTVTVKIPADIEYRVIGNAFGLLIASAGLLAGEMVRLRSFDYWLADIVPLLLLIWMGYRLYRNFLSTMNSCQGVPTQMQHSASAAGASRVHGEQVIAGQIPAKPSYSPDKVVAEVAKRIETQKAEALKKNKFNN